MLRRQTLNLYSASSRSLFKFLGLALQFDFEDEHLRFLGANGVLLRVGMVERKSVRGCVQLIRAKAS